VCNLTAVSATACVFGSPEDALRWPVIYSRTVTVGGVTVTCAEAVRATEVLLSNGACAIRAVLKAAGSPLADCDYHAVYRPGLDQARRALDETGRPGGAGRHLAKHAFAAAVRRAVADQACQAIGDAMDAFASDERYAAAIARDALAIAPGRVPLRTAA
jgi:hypothetical protein